MEARVKKCAVVFKPPSTILMFEIDPKYADDFKKLEGKNLEEHTLTLKKKKKKSENVNNFMWDLCRKIGKATNCHYIDVYRQAIREAGVFTDMYMESEAVEKFKKDWESNKIGRLVEYISTQGKYVDVRVYYGSSDYDGEEMRRLVNYVVDEANNYGIDTMTTNERERLLQLWQERVT